MGNFTTAVLERKKAHRRVFTTIRMFCGYKYKYQKRWGQPIQFRANNEQRRALTFAAGGLMKDACERRSARVVRHFLRDNLPMYDFKSKVVGVVLAVNFIKRTRKDVVFTRYLRKKFFLRQF